MKVKYLLLSMLAAFALLSCAKENGSSEVVPDNDVEGEDYMAVRFIMSGDEETKADGDFVAGTDDEVAVDNMRFLFFNDDGNQVADPYDVDGSEFSWTDVNDSSTTESIDEESYALLVLSNKTEDPTSIIAVANPDATTKAALTKSITMTGLKALYGNWANSSHTTSGTFLMSNAVYVKNDTVIVGTPVTSANIATTAAAAAANPVTISIEKGVAKVQVSQSTSFENDTDSTLNGNAINFVINKWWIDHDPTYGSLVKPLSATYSWTNWDWTDFTWNDIANKRSYWADQFGTPGDYQHRSVSDGVVAGSYAYTNENATTADSYADATQVVVEGTLQIDNTDTTIIEYQTRLYTKDGFETILTNLLSDVYKVSSASTTDTTIYTSVEKSDLEFTYLYNGDSTVHYDGVAIEDYESVVKVSFPQLAQGDLYKKVADTAAVMSQAEIDAALANVNLKVLCYREGRTYYYFKIRHNKDAVYSYTDTDSGTTTTHPLYGVIRNHLYVITLSGVSGLGTPLPQGDNFDVTPDTPENNNSYISAEIDILKYKEVDQDVVLGE